MKKYFLVLLLLILLLIFSVNEAIATSKMRAFTGYEGGGSGDLDSISCLVLAENDLAMVLDTDSSMLIYYWFDDGDESDENIPWTIKPDSYAVCGDGVWKAFTAWGFAPTSAPKLIFRDLDATDFDDNIIIGGDCSATGTGVEDCNARITAQRAGGQVDYALLPGDDDEAGFLKLCELTGNGDNCITLDVADSLAADYAVVLPSESGTLDIKSEVVGILVFDDSQDVTTGNGAGDVFFRIPSKFNGWDLVEVAAQVQTAGTTGNLDIMVYNVSQTSDFLSTAMRIETGETDTITSAQPGTIDTGNDDVTTGDSIRIDIDAVQTTAPKGLYVELTFKKP